MDLDKILAKHLSNMMVIKKCPVDVPVPPVLGGNHYSVQGKTVKRDVSFCGGQISQSKGLVSIDRSEAAALLSTTPRLRPRSSANDLVPLHCMGLVSLRQPDAPFHAR